MLLSTTSYCNKSFVDSLNPLVTLTLVTSYFNKLVNLRSYYSIIIELNLKIILPHQLSIGNNRLLYTYWKIGLTEKKIEFENIYSKKEKIMNMMVECIDMFSSG